MSYIRRFNPSASGFSFFSVDIAELGDKGPRTLMTVQLAP